MIVKVENKEGTFIRWDDCISVCFRRDDTTNENILICVHSNGKDATYPLEGNDSVFIMDGQGKTIDRLIYVE